VKTTIRDVAEAAGVSAMAVSKVLHGAGANVRVSEARAEHIRKIAREMHYQANDVARSLRSRKTMMIGVVFQHFTTFSDDNPYYPQLLNGVMAALFPAEYTLALCPKLIQNSLTPAIADGRFDGVLWARPDFTEASIEELRFSNFPLVFMHAPPESVAGIPTYCVDNVTGLRLAVEHLVDLGHVHIAHA
jgi:LacI family transcriptional regulator